MADYVPQFLCIIHSEGVKNASPCNGLAVDDLDVLVVDVVGLVVIFQVS